MTARYEQDLESHWIYDTATNGVGQLAEAFTGPASAKDYRRLHTYDSLGRPGTTTQVLTDGNYTSTPLYDAWARPAGVTMQRASDPAKAFTEGYNAQGYLNRINRNGETIWQVLEQDAHQRVTRTQAGNGLTQLRTFSVHSGRPLMHWLTTSSAAMRLMEQYQYDALGNITQRQLAWDGSGFVEDFDYDELNRLKWSQVQGLGRLNFDYDAAGNITSKTGVGTYAYPAQGASSVRPHAVSSINDGAGGITSFGYDANGNLTSGAQRALTWTSFDMPLTIGKTGAPTATFIYGPEHQRARQLRSDGGYTLYAGSQEVESQGGVLKVRTYWPMGLGFEVDQAGTATQKYWRYMDWLGSPVALTDASGNLVEKLAYDPWGQRRTLDGSATPTTLDGVLDNKGFTGHEMLDQLDLVHMNGRIYDPRVARFMSADPFVMKPEDGQGYNRFSYVSNNPTNATDPSGFTEEAKDQVKSNQTSGKDLKMSDLGDIKVAKLKDGKFALGITAENGKVVWVAVDADSKVTASDLKSTVDRAAATGGSDPVRSAIENRNSSVVGAARELAAERQITPKGLEPSGGWETPSERSETNANLLRERMVVEGHIHPLTLSLLQSGVIDIGSRPDSLASLAVVARGGKFAPVGREIRLVNGFYEAQGSQFKFSEYYYNKLWATGRGAPFLQAEEVLSTARSITPDRKAGFYRYVNDRYEMVYNPKTREVWHLQPLKK